MGLARDGPTLTHPALSGKAPGCVGSESPFLSAIDSIIPRPVSNPADPEAIIQRQLDAYNARDLGTLLEIYADDAELYEHPATLLARGTAALRARFLARFQELNLHAELRRRIAMGNFVIDHEVVTRTFPEGPGTLEVVMIYEVQAGRIAKSWSLPGAKTLA